MIALSLALLCAIAAPAQAGKAVVEVIGTEEAGTLGGQFDGADDVTVDPASGALVVGDSGNRRVQLLDASGAFIRAWGRDVDADNPSTGSEVCATAASCQAGTSGDLGGEFTGVGDVAVDSTGDIWVSEGFRIQKFDADGSFILALGRDVDAVAPGTGFEVCTVASQCKQATRGAGPGELFSVHDLAIGPGDDLFVADANNRRVAKYDGATGAFELAFGADVDPSGGDGGLETCTTACQAGPRISDSPPPGEFANGSPRSVAVDSSGSVYTADGPANDRRLQKFNASLTAASVVAPGLLSPEYVTVEPQNDHVYVADTEDSVGVAELDFAGALVDFHAAGGRIQPRALAVDHASGNLYLSSARSTNQILVANEPRPPAVTVESATGVGTHNATLHGTVNPNGLATGYHFEYRADPKEEWTAVPAEDADAGDGTDPVMVSASAEGLIANTTYRVRLVATKAYGGGVSTSEETTFTTAPAPPIVSGAAAVNVTESGVTLVGRIHPENDATRYRFEYGPDGGYGQAVPVPDGEIAARRSSIKVGQAVSGLEAGRTYHGRLVAANAAGITEGPDLSFETLPAPPAGREYELVSPADKRGAEVSLSGLGPHMPMAADDGGAAIFTPSVAFGDPEGVTTASPYRSVRDPRKGWHTEPIQPPKSPAGSVLETLHTGQYWLFTPDLSAGVFQSAPLTPPLDDEGSAAEGTENLYLRSFGPTSYELLTPGVPPGAGPVELDTTRIASSDDGGRVVFNSRHELPGMPPLPPFFGNRLNLWDRESGNVSVVSRLPDGTILPDPVYFAAPNDALSADGSRVIYASLYYQTLYMHDVDAGTTSFVSEEENSSADPTGAAQFWAASEDGSRAYFTSSQQLVDADTNGTTDLYLYTDSDDPANDQNLTLVSVDQEAADGDSADVQGVLDASEDGRRIYFVASGQLVAGGPTGPGPHLYLWDATGAEPTLTYVASLDRTDGKNWAGESNRRTSRITPDGRYLAFDSIRDLTDFESDGHRQVYLYDAGSDWLRCASCAPAGRPPAGDASMGLGGVEFNEAPGSWVNRALSADGSRLFFETPESLLPQDVNDRPDVYVFEDGRQRLISTGTGSGARFADASVDGDDVFFVTRERLVAEDRDDSRDLYNARVGGGFPPPSLPASCEGAACRGLPTPPPLANVPASMAPAREADRPPSGSPPRSERCEKRQLRVGKKLKRAKHRVKRLKRKARRAERAHQRPRVKRLRKKARRVRAKGREARKEARRCRKGTR